MARDLAPIDHLREEEEEEEYIDIDLNSAAFVRHTVPSPPRPTGFEFRLTSGQLGKQLLRPADELFYKGQLLPLRPPQATTASHEEYGSGQLGKSIVVTVPNTTSTTPFVTCNLSPAAYCRVSRELNVTGECSDEQVDLAHPKRFWSKKLKFIKQFALSSKLKASRAYIKSLFFAKSGGSAADHEKYCCVSKPKQCTNAYMKAAAKSTPFGQIQEEAAGDQMKRHSSSKRRPPESQFAISSSQHSTSFSSACSERSSIPILMRSSSVSSDMESSVQGAIAYCKKSQQLVYSRKSAGDIGFCLIPSSSSKISPNGQKQEGAVPRLCR